MSSVGVRFWNKLFFITACEWRLIVNLFGLGLVFAGASHFKAKNVFDTRLTEVIAGCRSCSSAAYNNNLITILHVNNISDVFIAALLTAARKFTLFCAYDAFCSADSARIFVSMATMRLIGFLLFLFIYWI